MTISDPYPQEKELQLMQPKYLKTTFFLPLLKMTFSHPYPQKTDLQLMHPKYFKTTFSDPLLLPGELRGEDKPYELPVNPSHAERSGIKQKPPLLLQKQLEHQGRTNEIRGFQEAKIYKKCGAQIEDQTDQIGAFLVS